MIDISLISTSQFELKNNMKIIKKHTVNANYSASNEYARKKKEKIKATKILYTNSCEKI